MKKPSIPSVSNVVDPATQRVLSAIKVNLDDITGAVTGEIPQLAATATLAQVINTVNAIIVKLNRSGS
jgi:hypothetical protein